MPCSGSGACEQGRHPDRCDCKVDGDPARPETWFRAMVKAIAGIQRGDTGPATTYLRFVESNRGRECAVETRDRIKRLAGTRAFANALSLLDQPAPKPQDNERRQGEKKKFR